MLLVLLIALVPGLVGFSAVVGDEVARVRLSYVLPGDDVATVTPLVAEATAGGVPVVMLVAVALGCGLVVRFLALDLDAADDRSGGRVEAMFESARVSGGGSATIDDRDPALWRLLSTDGRVLADDAPNRISYESDGRPRPGPAVSARCRR